MQPSQKTKKIGPKFGQMCVFLKLKKSLPFKNLVFLDSVVYLYVEKVLLRNRSSLKTQIWFYSAVCSTCNKAGSFKNNQN